MFGKYDPELMCYAHSKGARVVLKGTAMSFFSHKFVFEIWQFENQLIWNQQAKRCSSSWLNEGDVPLSSIVDPKQRSAWIAEKVNLAKAQFMDGINLDIEQVVESESPEYYALTQLVNETTEAFHREIPGSQVNEWPQAAF